MRRVPFRIADFGSENPPSAISEGGNLIQVEQFLAARARRISTRERSELPQDGSPAEKRLYPNGEVSAKPQALFFPSGRAARFQGLWLVCLRLKHGAEFLKYLVVDPAGKRA